MSLTDQYARCTVAGDGKLFVEGSRKAESFKIIDMSAAGIRLETTATPSKGTPVKLKIRLIGGTVDAVMDVNGKIVEEIESGYEIEFTDLSDAARMEIDQLMRDTCNLHN